MNTVVSPIVLGLAAAVTLCLMVLPVGADEVVIDGSRGEDEWSGAVEHPLENGGSALLRTTPDEIHVGFIGTDSGWAHVYLFDGERVLVLHASAALGTAEYRREGDVWNANRTFEWGVRNKELDEAAASERQLHFDDEGWVASTIHMGEETFIEYRIDRKLLGDSGRMAFAFAVSADEPSYWPATLEDDTLAEQLIFGNSPTPLRFDPRSWVPVD